MTMLNQLNQFGALRALLVFSTIVLIVASPFAQGGVHLHDYRLLTGVVAPALMIIFVFVLLLDITMTWIFSIDADPTRRQSLIVALRVEALTLLALLAAWTPFLLRLFNVWQPE